MKRFLTAFAAALTLTGEVAIASPVAVATAAPPTTAAPAATASPNAMILARAKEWFHRIQAGTIDRKQLSTTVNSLLTDAMIKQISAQTAPLGDPIKFEQVTSGTQEGSQYYVYGLSFASGDHWNFIIAFDPASNLITGLRIVPAT